MRYGFGVDLGGTTVKLAYFNSDGYLLDKWEIPTGKQNHGEGILPDIAASIRQYLDQRLIPNSRIFGIGIGVPGPVDQDGTVHGCDNLGWGTFNVQKELSRLTGFPVMAGNDANVAALGECWKGGGQGYSDLVMVTLGTGVGGGIILGGKPLFGVRGCAGELGHMVLCREETEQCGCGKCGCVEQYCSATGVVRLAKRYLEKNSCDSILRQTASLTCKDVFDAAGAGDPAAAAVLQQYYSLLGEFLSNLCVVLDPQVIVLGGGVSKAGKVLLDGVAPHFRHHAFRGVTDTKITLAKLGNDAGAYGAFRLALQSFYE